MPTASRPSRVFRGAAIVALTAALMVSLMPAAGASPRVSGPTEQLAVPGQYIVTLTDRPIATYAGGVKGLSSTRPTRGQHVNVNSNAAKRYENYLSGKQDSAAARVGVKPLERFSVAVNAFTASLTPDQATTLGRAPGVLDVAKDKRVYASDDSNSQDFLKLSGSKGVWRSVGGIPKAGRGVVVGVIDTGIWPESKSFAGAALGTAKPTRAHPDRPYKVGNSIVMKKADGGTFTGTCQTGERWTADLCNTKLISARYFNTTWLQRTPVNKRLDFLSPRDADGHGSHTASTAAGNHGVKAKIRGASFGKISGVAPAAKVAVYKALWKTTDDPDEASGFSSDLVDAVDQAVADGVDVLNYSVGGADDLLESADIAFLSAASAGIFVAASAGNSGPGASTVAHVSPWLTTVGASTLAPQYGTLVANNKKYTEPALAIPPAGVGPAPLVLSTDVKLNTATDADAALCLANTLDPAKVAGKIVFCDRGDIVLVDKAGEVARAGGIGVIIGNVPGGGTTVDAIDASVPLLMLPTPDSQTVRAHAHTTGATATIKAGNLTKVPTAPYPQIADFSSRGPSTATGGDLLKPDITAPGVSVLAAYSPESKGSTKGRNFSFLDGTSMASPHVAGMAALYLGVHPTASPMTIKSALMTTSKRLVDADGKVSRDYFAQGAGNARPDRMLHPGVVFNSSDADWLAYLEGQGINTGTGVAPIDPSDYNSPSISIGKLVASQTVTRRVTALKRGKYRITASVPGVAVKITPSVLSFSKAGRTKTVKLRLTRRNAPLGTVTFGSVYLRGAHTTARLPVAVVPQAVDAPAEIAAGSGASGSVTYSVEPGFSGAFPVTVHGLAAAGEKTGEVSTGNGDPADLTEIVPAGTKVARFVLNSDDPSADIDLAVYLLDDQGVATLVGQSGSPTGHEQVTLVDPEPGTYVAEVAPFADPVGASGTTFKLDNFVVGPNAGNLTVSPANATVTSNKPLTLTASWSGLDASKPYLGFVQYVDGTGTLIDVN